MQAQPEPQWRRPRLLRLPGRSLIRVPLPVPSANAGQHRNWSRSLPSLSELGTSAVPSDASSDLLNWEKQLGSWEEDSPRSTADLSAETADELEEHARQLAAEVSQQGSEWEPLTASMDDSGAGGDLIAGMGSDSTTQIADTPPVPQDEGSRTEIGTSAEADVEAKSLVPMWPLSLYPLSYRQDYSDADPQRVDSSSPPAAPGEQDREAQPDGRCGERAGGPQLEPVVPESSKDRVDRNGAIEDTLTSFGGDTSQPWQEESLPSSVSDDYAATEQDSLQEASTSALWRSRRSQAPDAADKVGASALIFHESMGCRYFSQQSCLHRCAEGFPNACGGW